MTTPTRAAFEAAVGELIAATEAHCEESALERPTNTAGTYSTQQGAKFTLLALFDAALASHPQAWTQDELGEEIWGEVFGRYKGFRNDAEHCARISLRRSLAAPQAWTREGLKAALYSVIECDAAERHMDVILDTVLQRPLAAEADLEGLDNIGLHEAIHVIYTVDGYTACREINDGAAQSHEADGVTVRDALANLSRAILEATGMGRTK